MQSKNGNFFVAALCAIVCLFSIVYVSCTKTGDNPACDGVSCLNQGFCLKGKCICPVGYEGKNCGTRSVAKYIGTYDVRETVIQSTQPNTVGKTRNYMLFFKTAGTPTTFFINNFLGNAEYNQVVAVLDSTNSYNFKLDSLRPLKMWYDQVVIQTPSTGSYDATNRTIQLYVGLRFLNSTYNWQEDKLKLELTPHNF